MVAFVPDQQDTSLATELLEFLQAEAERLIGQRDTDISQSALHGAPQNLRKRFTRTLHHGGGGAQIDDVINAPVENQLLSQDGRHQHLARTRGGLAQEMGLLIRKALKRCLNTTRLPSSECRACQRGQ